MERWKDIPNYEGYYQASNLGNIKSLLFQCNLTGKKYVREKILKQKVDKQNNKRVELWKNGNHKTWLVHRLIGITFLGIPQENMTINHKDGNRLNNNTENLEWLSLEDNIKHGFENNLYSTQIRIKLIDKKNKRQKTYNSLTKGSKAIGKNDKYLSTMIKRNKYENKDYYWEVV